MEPLSLPRKQTTNEFWSSTLSLEVAQLLVLLAAKPASGLRARSHSAPLDVLAKAQMSWEEILRNQSFSTSAGKKQITSDKKSVIVARDDMHAKLMSSESMLADRNMKVPSKRIGLSWNIVEKNPDRLQEWLEKMGRGLTQNTNNLKLLLEALLLGRDVFDDNKFLERLGNSVVEDCESQVLLYALGRRDPTFEAPETWISALFLLGQSNWIQWDSLVDPEAIGQSAALAPAPKLAERLVALGRGSETRTAVGHLAKSISADAFFALHDVSWEAAAVLTNRNPSLLFSTYPVKRAYENLGNKIYGIDSNNLPWDFVLLTRSPVWQRRTIAELIRRTRSNDYLVALAANRIVDGTWSTLPDTIREFLIDTPHLLDELLYLKPIKVVVNEMKKEVGSSEINSAVARVANRTGSKKKRLAASLVAAVGSTGEISAIDDVHEPVDSKFVAAIINARWKNTDNKQVLKRIRKDLAGRPDVSTIIEMLADSDLRKKLKKIPSKHS